MSIVVLGLLLVQLLLVALLATLPFREVSRTRLERFARRTCLQITPENGPRVIAYLATTRRWRGGGILLSAGLALVLAWSTGTGIHLQGLWLFAGWFVGAVIAEWRVGSRARDRRTRAASLVPRRVSDYVPTSLLVFTTAAFLGVVGFGAAVMAFLHRSRLELTMWLALGLALAAVIVWVARHVLQRPQVLAGPDVVAADEALRNRSLHVLFGSGLVLAAWVLTGIANIAARDTSWGGDGAASVLAAIAAIALPLLGILAATGSFAPRRSPLGRSVVPT